MKALRFLSGMLGMLLAVLCAVLIPASSAQRFEQALLSTVDAPALAVTQADLRAFARETMTYLTGGKEAWEPQISLCGLSAQDSIGPAFRVHMQEVRAWVQAAPWVLGAGVLLCALLLVASRGAGRKAYLWGVFAALGLIVCVLVWAVLDFHSLWMVIHRLFIPGGIFSARDPVMQLFPLGLFFSYVPSVCGWLLAGIAAATVPVWAGWRKVRS